MMKPSNRRKLEEIHEEGESDGTWAISYGDMVTLLLCFFILFFTIDPQKDYRESVDAALMKILEPAAQKAKDNRSPANVEMSIGENKDQGVEPALLKKWNGSAYKVGNRILVEFPGVSFFNSGKVDLTKDGEKSLKEFLKLYQPYMGQYKIGVRAFTDPRPVRNIPRSFRNNLELSALRSVSAIRQLSQLGVPITLLRVGGYGELKVTAQQLASLPPEVRKPSSELDLARKIVLVIEPGGENDL